MQICEDIQSIKEKFAEAGIPLNDGGTRPTKNIVWRFLHLYRAVSDPRCQGMVLYPLPEILLIAFLAVLADADNWVEIEQFGLSNERWLKKFLRLKNGIPSHDTFRRVFGIIDTSEFQDATVCVLVQNIASIKRTLGVDGGGIRFLCVDGKEERGTGRKYSVYAESKVRNLQTLHIYDRTNGVCVFSKGIDSKTNEIPVAQKALGLMDLKNVIVTADAMHAQKGFTGIVKQKGGDYVVGLKGNQSALRDDVGLYFDEQTRNRIRSRKKNFYDVEEKNHSQYERRRYYLAPAARIPDARRDEEWAGLKAFVCYEKFIMDTQGNKTRETRFYIASVTDVRLCADAIRGHWKVESMHWSLDTVFHEDDNSTMDRKAFDNIGLLKKMCNSLMTVMQPLMGKNVSKKVMRKRFGWNYTEMLSKLLFCIDPDAIERALRDVEAGKKARKRRTQQLG